MPPKYFLVKIALLTLICNCIAVIGFAANAINEPKTALFDTVAKVDKPSRVEFARQLYKRTCRQLPAARAMAQLDELTRLAQQIKDRSLECAVYDMRADYYSVNYGFNPNSNKYHLQAVDFAVENRMLLDEGIYLHRMGIYYAIYNKKTIAVNYLLRSLDVFKKIGYKAVPNVSLYFFQIADFYYDIDDYENALNYSLKALHYNTLNSRLTINTTNSVGLIYRNKGNYPTALKYFNDAIRIATQQKDSVWIGIAKGNIGSVLLMQKKYDEALPYILEDYQTSLKFNEVYNGALALLRLVSINIAKGNFTRAGEQLITAEHIKGPGMDNIIYKVELYRLRSLYYERTGNIPMAYTYLKKLNVAKDSLKNADNNEAVERVKMKWEQEKYRNSLIHMKNQADNNALQRNTIIIIVALSAAVLALIYNRKLLKSKADSELLKIEKLRVDQELSNASSELLLYTQNLQEKNAIIQNFKDEIEQFNVQHTDNEKNDHLNTLMQASIMTDASWIEFKRLYLRVHPTFFIKLKEIYPSVSETDQRLLALIKLNINNREMATMLGITTEGIKKAKQRLRKKMELSKDVTIEAALSAL